MLEDGKVVLVGIAVAVICINGTSELGSCTMIADGSGEGDIVPLKLGL